MERQVGQKLHTFFLEYLASMSEVLRATVVDGGTAAGIMQLMGQARAEHSASFPFIGVVVSEKMAIPIDSPTQRT